MKKWIAIILTISLLAVSLSALAEGTADTVTSATQAQKQKQSGSQSRAACEQEDSQTPGTSQQDSQVSGRQGKQRNQKPGESQASGGGQTGRNSRMTPDGGEAQPEQPSVKEQKAVKIGAAKKSPFDAFAAQGIISQETADQIKAYLKAKKAAKVSEEPSDETSEETAPENGVKAPRQQGKKGKIQVTQELLQELLDAEIITPTEYDAMLPVQTEATD